MTPPMLFGVFTFATPALFAGMALLSLPLVAHLLHRRHAATDRLSDDHVLAAVDGFTVEAVSNAALGAAMAAMPGRGGDRPGVHCPSWLDAASAAGRDGSAVVLLIDASASTKQRSAGAPIFDRLRASAGRTLDALSPGLDGAAVVVAAANPSRSLPSLTGNFEALRAELAALEPTDERADFADALVEAGEMLAERPSKRIVIFSDLQADNWKEIVADAHARDLLPPGALVTIAELDGSPIENLALSSPRTSPPEPLAGSPVQLIVEAANYSPRVKQARVEARLDDVVVGSQTLTLEPGQRQETVFEATLDSVDFRRVVFSLPPDDFPDDDRVYLGLSAAARHSIAVISDDDPKDPESGLFYLVRALTPHGDKADRFSVRVLRGADVSVRERDPHLAPDETIVVCDADSLTSVGAERIRKHVEEGSGLLAFRSDAPLDAGLSALDAATASKDWLPSPSGILRRRERREALHIQGRKWRSRFLRMFDQTAQTAFARASFFRMTDNPTIRPGTETLLTFSDESTALAAIPRGRGWIVETTFSPSASSTDLSKFGVFVALVQTLVQELQSPPEKAIGCRAGRPCRIIAATPASARRKPWRCSAPRALPSPRRSRSARRD